MKKFLPLFLILIIFKTSVHSQDIRKVFSENEKQTLFMLREIEKAKELQVKKDPGLLFPCSMTPTGELKLIASRDWRSGFFSGILWYLYEYTGKLPWKAAAEQFTAYSENEKLYAGSHDMGFKIYNSFGNGLRLTKNDKYREVIIQAAKTNIKRFNPKIGCIRSWDHNRDKWDYPVIIDNLMNLELLFEATKMTGDSSFYKIAVTHANTTMKNSFRPDFSSYHVIDYDTITGAVRKKSTHQGVSSESSWSRGQAWGLYGYVMCYRYTKDKRYLELSENIARFILKHPNLPSDMVPYWDFNAPGIPNEPRDVSAAAITTSALYELSTYSRNGSEFATAAAKMLQSLTDNYRAAAGTNHGFLLLHGTGGKPSNTEVDVPLIYADYYYLEALLRSQKAAKAK